MEATDKQEKTRLLFLDVAKLIGIILVIYAHARGSGLEIMYIYAFHMPLFFVINGMTFKIREGESSAEFLMRKIKGYIIPFLILSLLLIFCDMWLDGIKGTTIDWKYFVNKSVYVYQNPRPYPIWFVLALFFSDIWLYLFIRLSFKKDYLVFIYSLLFLALAIIFYKYTPQKLDHSFDTSFVGVFFVTLGYMFYRSWNRIPREFILKNRFLSLGVGLTLLAACFLLVYYLYTKNPASRARLEMWGNYYEPHYIRLPAAAFGAFGTIFICNAIANKPMAYLGRHTLVVMAFQQNLTIRVFREYIAKNWLTMISPFQEKDINVVWFALTCTLFSLAVLIPLSILLTETHLSYAFFKKPAKWYLKLIDKIKSKFKKNKSE